MIDREINRCSSEQLFASVADRNFLIIGDGHRELPQLVGTQANAHDNLGIIGIPEKVYREGISGFYVGDFTVMANRGQNPAQWVKFMPVS
jgi:hypothetical protein